MKTLMAITAAVAFSAGAVAAQETTQTGVIGESGNATFSVQVQGANGNVYNCRPEIETIDGVRARRCVLAGGGGGLAGAGAGLTGGVGAGLGALVLVAIAAGSDGSSSTTTTGSSASDIRLKEDITYVGMAANGLPLYNFRYVGGEQTYEGVMAQDVLGVMPGAVSTMSNGYMQVNYGMLGLEMRAVD